MSRRKQAKPNRLQEGEEDDNVRPGDGNDLLQDGDAGRSRLGEDSFDDEDQSVGSGDEGKLCDFFLFSYKSVSYMFYVVKANLKLNLRSFKSFERSFVSNKKTTCII